MSALDTLPSESTHCWDGLEDPEGCDGQWGSQDGHQKSGVLVLSLAG